MASLHAPIGPPKGTSFAIEELSLATSISSFDYDVPLLESLASLSAR